MDLTTKYPIISDQITRAELVVVLRELQKVIIADTAGDVVELGCYVGTAALFLQRLLAGINSKQLHVYDSFAGLPPKHIHDASPVGEQFRQGELIATKSQLIKNFKKAHLPLPIIHTCWFEQLKPADLPDRISFAFLDGDFYTSILASLKVIWPKLQPGSVVVIDDYHTEALPGVKKAIDEWRIAHKFNLQTEASLAIIRPIYE